MKIPQFTMPEVVTDETQIQLLQYRIKELEYEMKSLNKFDGAPYYHKSESVHISMGLNDEQHSELKKIALHWLRQYQEEPSRILESIENAPLSLREKIFLVFIISRHISSPIGPSFGPSSGPTMSGPMSLDAFMKLMKHGGK